MTRTACLNGVYELAKQDPRVVFIGSDLSPNTLPEFQRDFPDRFFMEGINEQNCIGMAAGMAMEGYIPYVNTIATFLTRRCYEQVAMDVCAHNLPVRLIGNGGGLLYAPLGPTHCAIEDMAIMRALPNMTVMNCGSNEEIKHFIQMSLVYEGPMYFRLGRDNDDPYEITQADDAAPILIVSTGIMSAKAAQIQRKLSSGIGCEVHHMPIIKPFQHVGFLERVCTKRLTVIMEEGVINGGLGSAALECLADNDIQVPVLRFGIPDAFPHHYGEREDSLETYGLTPEKMAAKIKEKYEQLPN